MPIPGIGRRRGIGSDRLRQLRAFCHTARLGSVSHAAKYIGTSQPMVSVHVRRLEDELGVPLFERRGPRISLTSVGASLYELAMPLVVRMDRLPDTFAESYHGAPADALTIGAGQASAAYLLPKYIERFREHWPEADIKIRNATGEERLRWLHGYEVDLAVGGVDVAPPDVDFHPMLVSQFVLITAVDHPLAGRESVDIKEAAAYAFVGHTKARYVAQAVEIILRLHGVAPEIVVEIDGWGIIMKYVAAGMGIAFVPDLCLSERSRVWRIPFSNVIPPRRYGVMTRRDGLLPLQARRFLNVVRNSTPRSPARFQTGRPTWDSR